MQNNQIVATEMVEPLASRKRPRRGLLVSVLVAGLTLLGAAPAFAQGVPQANSSVDGGTDVFNVPSGNGYLIKFYSQDGHLIGGCATVGTNYGQHGDCSISKVPGAKADLLDANSKVVASRMPVTS